MRIFKTFFLMAALTFVLMLIGGMVGGQMGAIIALSIAFIMNFFSYWFSDKIVLMMYKAEETTPQQRPELHAIVEDLVNKAALPKPRVYVIQSATPNAFATGRNPSHAAVAVTTGIMNILNKEELKGVIAHELSHIRHYDILIGSIAGTIVGAISWIASMAQWAAIFGGMGGRGDDDEGEGSGGIIGLIAMAIIAPLIATLLQLAISRQREYAADAGAAKLTGNPMGLANALNKLEKGNEAIPLQDAGPATAHMFIVNPLTASSFASWFSTHPSTEQRIERLMAMARDGVRD
jgi:heat shock protein HtpX